MFKKISLTFLCSLIGAVFIFSGYSKLYPIEPFEYTFVDIGIVNWEIAPFVARILIGLEFLIGVLFLLNINLRKITYKLGISVLTLFSVYLMLLMMFSGNKGNCGCFGELFPMTPLWALIKNVGMLLLIFLLYKFHDGFELSKKIRILNILIFITAFTFPFILNPVELDYSEAYLNKPSENYKLELDSLYANATLTVPPKTLSKGKHIIAFMSLTCPHCRIAANKIRIVHKNNPNISFYFVLNGDEKNLKPFYENTHTEDIDHCILLGRSFVYLAGTSLPTIYLINNSMVEHEVNYMNLNQKEIEDWLGK